MPPTTRATRQQIAAQLAPLLPMRMFAEESWLMVGTNFDKWKTVRQMRFRS